MELRELSILLLPVLKTVEGIYRKGQIELVELPQDVSDRTQVLITFLDPGKIDPTKVRQLIDRLETIAGIQQGFVDNLNDLGDEV
nr:hypothetical protein [Trichocoleus sp. FACHB-90]